MRQRACSVNANTAKLPRVSRAEKPRKAAQGTPRHTDRCRGNAVGAPSVKVGTAPDTPPRGQVLARHLPRYRLDRRAWSVMLRQLSGSPLPLRVHGTRGGLGEPEAGGGPGRATPAVWARSGTPAPAMPSGLSPRSPAAGPGSGRLAQEAGTGGSTCHDGAGMADIAVPDPAESPDRYTGSTGRVCGRRPLPGKDPS